MPSDFATAVTLEREAKEAVDRLLSFVDIEPMRQSWRLRREREPSLQKR